MVLGNIGNSANQILIKIKGDDKDFQHSLSKSDKSMSSFATKAKAYGPMVGAAFAAAAVGFVAMSIKWAAAEETVTRQTESLLKAQGVMWNDVGEECDAYMKKLERLTTYNDTDLQIAFNSMIAAGMSYTEAMNSMNTVTSMSYSLNRDLASMALLVGKAYNGQTGRLAEYGIVLDESLDKTEKFTGLQEYVADNFADASDRSKTFEGQMANLNNQIHNVAEVIGAELLPPLTAFLTVIGDWASGGGAAKTVAAFQVVGKSVWLFIDSLQVLQATQDLLVARVGLTLGTVTKLEYNAAVKNLNNMSDAYAKTAMGINDAMAVLGSQAGKNFNSNFSNNVFDGGSARAQGEADGTSYGSGVASGIASKIPEVQRASSKMAQSAMSDPGYISTVGKYREGESYTRKSGDWTISYQSGGR
jgi:hypothetical protein